MKRIASVLIVDDSPEDCYLATYALKRTKSVEHVWSIHEPQQALGLYADYAATCKARPAEFPPTLILLDINMPGMTGFEFADALQARAFDEDEVRPIVICMVTSSLHEADVERAKQNPLVQAYYAKPLTKENIAELVARFGVEVG